MTLELRIYPIFTVSPTTIFHLHEDGVHVRSFETLVQFIGWLDSRPGIVYRASELVPNTERDQLKAQNAELLEALAYYADASNYEEGIYIPARNTSNSPAVIYDSGDIARAAIAKHEK